MSSPGQRKRMIEYFKENPEFKKIFSVSNKSANTGAIRDLETKRLMSIRRRQVSFAKNAVGMKNGLYQVLTDFYCAGFLVENENIVRCAPILKRRLEQVKNTALWRSE